MAPNMNMTPGEMTADQRFSVVGTDLSGMAGTGGIAVSIAQSNASTYADFTAGCTVFGTGFQTAVDLFGQTASLLGTQVRNAKITYTNADQHAADLNPPQRRPSGVIGREPVAV
ncbi:MAG TPA: hypothetical protein VHC49_14395 [Mycobacteriales bacterium]|nr:hypothetical protein [Mycobacteriales bacterium]